MPIKKLPQYLINKLKAWEIVERPASIVKELMENAIDAWADKIILELQDWWKKLILLKDNGEGVQSGDLDQTIERYSTSKIYDEKDLDCISSYGFRGEALASISEVSKFKIQSKTSSSQIWHQLVKMDSNIDITQIPMNKNHGTNVYVQDIFHNVPARKKFLKTSRTEYRHIRDVFVDFALIHYDKDFQLYKDDKCVLDLSSQEDLVSRILKIYNTDREDSLITVQKQDENLNMYGVVSDSGLTFSWHKHIKFFVNNRPVKDKIMKRALLDAYNRQIASGEYPFAIVYLDISSDMVDVNVHPRKQRVKFIDPWSIYEFTRQAIKSSLWAQQTVWWTINSNSSKVKSSSSSSNSFGFNSQSSSKKTISKARQQTLSDSFLKSGFGSYKAENTQPDSQKLKLFDEYLEILWQIRNSYILLQGKQDLYFVDQHALAERIQFEKLRKDLQSQGIKPLELATPIKVKISKDVQLEDKIDQLADIGFDVSRLSEQKLVIYSIPKALSENRVDIAKLMDKLLYMDSVSISDMMDRKFAMSACKTSIKAGQKLSVLEMKNLLQDAQKHIDWQFVCQHGRPGFVKVSKTKIEGLFDR